VDYTNRRDELIGLFARIPILISFVKNINIISVDATDELRAVNKFFTHTINVLFAEIVTITG
jgi:hypothetical protein